MKEITYVSIRENPQLAKAAVEWFSGKWGVPEQAYLDCMNECLNDEVPYDWLLCLADGQIIGGLGVIANDFHDRPDLSPNICAVYVEPAYRRRGIAGKLLNKAVEVMKERGVSPLYLLTDHTGFYERYGWEYLCEVQGNDEDHLSRMYVHY
ncbi:MAG: GNAT family N-acetyltransferase [Erysipelotrichaceae bacterium]|nr:GNAT family N-acetyltransferase [Erysipelotrichaceae bacterium]